MRLQSNNTKKEILVNNHLNEMSPRGFKPAG